jgi:hypothetical protein
MTAVEKLEISLLGLISFDSEELRAKYKERIGQAKEMEKQQIIDAYCNGCKNPLLNKTHEEKAEKYYNETFNK